MIKKTILTVLLLTIAVIGQSQTLNGIDLSRYQGDVNWKQIAKNEDIQYVYLKATEGYTIIDPMYKENLDSARKAGLLVGSYHIYSYKSTAEQQFKNLKSTIKKSKQDLIPILDIEPPRRKKKLNTKEIDKLLRLMENHYGVRPIIYVCEAYYNKYFAKERYKKYKFFIANYIRKPNCKYTMWQYTNKGYINGIDTRVDLSTFSDESCLDDIKIQRK